MNSETALATVDQSEIIRMSVAVDSLAAMRELGMDFAKSGIFGSINQSQGTVSLITMRDERLTVSQFRRKYQWVGEELSTRPNWMLGEFKRMGGKVHIVQADETACEIEFIHWDGETLTMRITKDQMVANGVATKSDGKTLKDNWRKFADDMLFARVCGKALRRLAPEVFAACYTDGEAQDFESNLPSAPKEIPSDQIKSRISKIASATVKETPTPSSVDNTPESSPSSDAEPVTPEVLPSAADFDDADGQLTCPVKGEWFGKSYAEIASANPDIIMALLTCNRNKHPELTADHLAALERISSKLAAN